MLQPQSDAGPVTSPAVPQGTTVYDLPYQSGEALPPPLPADRDPVAAYYCKTLDQVRERHYDVVVVGGGAVGAAVVHRLLRKAQKNDLRVLLLEKGGFLLPEHVQNLHPRYQRLMRDAVSWPWRKAEGTTYDLAPQIPFLGGRALFWSTWIPRPTGAQLPRWPKKVTVELEPYWDSARELLGAVLPSSMGKQFDTLHPKLRKRLKDGLRNIPYFHDPKDEKVLEVELASRATESTLGYRKFSPAPLLVQDIEEYSDHLDVVTGCEVQRILHDGPSGGTAGGLHRATDLLTSQGRLPLADDTRLVLASGIVEPTGLLLDSFRDVLPDFAGTNLGGHVASWFSARVPRTAWPGLGDTLQIGCLYVRGTVPKSDDPEHGLPEARDFHIHLMGASNPHPEKSAADLYRLIPDSFDQEFLEELSGKEHIGFLVHCLGEWRSNPKDSSGSRVDSVHGQTVLRIVPSDTDEKLRTHMDAAAQQLVKQVLAQGVRPEEIEYWHPATSTAHGHWSSELPGDRMKDALVHESGTLWMGENPADSVTTTDCRLHRVSNVYVGGAATFPTSGSWNPTLAAVALGQRLADHLLT